MHDTSDTQVGKSYRLMVTALFHLFDAMFYGSHPNVINVPMIGGRRFRVFMEYILRDDVDPDDFTLIDARVAVRVLVNKVTQLHIYIETHNPVE